MWLWDHYVSHEDFATPQTKRYYVTYFDGLTVFREGFAQSDSKISGAGSGKLNWMFASLSGDASVSVSKGMLSTTRDFATDIYHNPQPIIRWSALPGPSEIVSWIGQNVVPQSRGEDPKITPGVPTVLMRAVPGLIPRFCNDRWSLAPGADAGISAGSARWDSARAECSFRVSFTAPAVAKGSALPSEYSPRFSFSYQAQVGEENLLIRFAPHLASTQEPIPHVGAGFSRAGRHRTDEFVQSNQWIEWRVPVFFDEKSIPVDQSRVVQNAGDAALTCNGNAVGDPITVQMDRDQTTHQISYVVQRHLDTGRQVISSDVNFTLCQLDLGVVVPLAGGTDVTRRLNISDLASPLVQPKPGS
jgi:hypothetical protein